MERKTEIKDLERKMEILDDNLLDLDNEAMELLAQMKGVSEQAAPLIAVLENIKYKLQALGQRKEITLMEKWKGLEVLKALKSEDGVEGMHR